MPTSDTPPLALEDEQQALNTSSVSHQQEQNKNDHWQEFWFGAFFGLLAAVSYTLANIALRQSASSTDWTYAIWVTFHKAIPVSLVGWLLVLRQRMRGEISLPPWSFIPALIGTGVVMQFGGNVLFQVALAHCGLALTVPITFALIIVTGATLGRVILGETVSLRSTLAIGVLITSIAILCFGVKEASQSVQGTPSTSLEILWGILSACFSGMSYGLGGVMIRKTVRKIPVASTLVLITSTGVIGCGIFSYFALGWTEMVSLPWTERRIMLLAGIFNAVGFFSIARSLRSLSVIQSNLINSTQILLAALAGWIFFQEPFSNWLKIGLLLTAFGLFLMDRSKK